MMQEIKALDINETYEVRHDAGYGDNVSATLLAITPESVTLELTIPTSYHTGNHPDAMERYETVRIANEDDEIMALLNVEFIYDED